MSRCRKCGTDMGRMAGTCHDCKKAFADRRLAIFNEIEAEIGPLVAANHEEYKRRVKMIERRMRREASP